MQIISQRLHSGISRDIQGVWTTPNDTRRGQHQKVWKVNLPGRSGSCPVKLFLCKDQDYLTEDRFAFLFECFPPRAEQVQCSDLGPSKCCKIEEEVKEVLKQKHLSPKLDQPAPSLN